MKKWFCGLMAVCLLFGFAACKEQADSELQKEASSSETTIVEENNPEQSGEPAAGIVDGALEHQPSES